MDDPASVVGKVSPGSTWVRATVQQAGFGPREAAILADIYAAILYQHLPPGTKLAEELLASIYGVARANVRRVLQALAAEKLVNLIPGRGAFVATLTAAAAHDVFAARTLLETALLHTLRAPPAMEALGQLRAILAEELAARRTGDREAMIRLSADFHLALAGILGNEIILQLLENLVARSSVIIAMYEAESGECCLHGDHERIVAAIEDGTGDHAALLMAMHLANIEEGLLMKPHTIQPVDVRAVLTGLARPS